VKDNDETLDNWVEKFDMLCEPKWKIGLLGSMYFIGVIVGMTFVPPLADAFGRKIIFIVTLIISVFAQLGLILTNNLYEAYVYQFFIGSTFAGRVIVGLNYMLEFVIPSWHQAIIFWLLISECISTILMTAYVQFIDKCWFSL
jgi:MFS family permease